MTTTSSYSSQYSGQKGAIATTTRDGKPSLTYPKVLKHTLSTHVGPVNIVRYNHGTSRYCLSGGSDRTIRLWNPSAGKEVKVYKGHGYEVLGIDIASDNATFASCGGDKSILIWDVASGTVLRRLGGHFGKINVVKYTGTSSSSSSSGKPTPTFKNTDSSVLISGSYDSKVMIWDMRSQSRVPIQTLQDARDSITSLETNAGGGLAEILVGSVDGCVRAYDVRMGEMVEDTIGASVTSIVLSASGRRQGETYAVASLDSKIRLMDRSNGQLLATFSHPSFVNTSYRSQISFGGQGESTIIAGDDSGRLFTWDVVSGKLVDEPEKIHEKVVMWVETHPTGEGGEMLTASADGTIKVWGERKT